MSLRMANYYLVFVHRRDLDSDFHRFALVVQPQATMTFIINQSLLRISVQCITVYLCSWSAVTVTAGVVTDVGCARWTMDVREQDSILNYWLCD